MYRFVDVAGGSYHKGREVMVLAIETAATVRS